jgi:hypothetical protein
MPVALSYPGVYVEEIPSGVHTIIGVATSITAFIGRAPMGPVDSDPDGPVTINSFGDFQRTFGGLDPLYPMSYAVRDFYLNGGSQAIIVRLYKASDGKAAKAQIKLTNLTLESATAGVWGNNLRVRIDNKVSADVATMLGLTAAGLFNVTVRDTVRQIRSISQRLDQGGAPRRSRPAGGPSHFASPPPRSCPLRRSTSRRSARPKTSVWADPYSTAVAGRTTLSTAPLTTTHTTATSRKDRHLRAGKVRPVQPALHSARQPRRYTWSASTRAQWRTATRGAQC